MPPNRRNLINLPHIFQEVNCRTDRYKNSFFPNAVVTWNKTISDFEQLPSYEALKVHLISLFRPKIRSTFGIHDPSYLRFIFQFRVGLSDLKSHKKRYNFADTLFDMCSCNQGVEDVRHFFLQCPLYNTHRAVLTTNVNEIINRNNLVIPDSYETLLLYGHSSLQSSENRRILLETLKYIKNSLRFS